MTTNPRVILCYKVTVLFVWLLTVYFLPLGSVLRLFCSDLKGPLGGSVPHSPLSIPGSL